MLKEFSGLADRYPVRLRRGSFIVPSSLASATVFPGKAPIAALTVVVALIAAWIAWGVTVVLF